MECLLSAGKDICESKSWCCKERHIGTNLTNCKCPIKRPLPNKCPLHLFQSQKALIYSRLKHLKPTSFKARFWSPHQQFVLLFWEIYSKDILKVLFMHQKMLPFPLINLNLSSKYLEHISILAFFMGNLFKIYA